MYTDFKQVTIFKRYTEYKEIGVDAVYLVDRVNKARIQSVFEKLYESLAAGLMCVLWLQFHLNSQKNITAKVMKTCYDIFIVCLFP